MSAGATQLDTPRLNPVSVREIIVTITRAHSSPMGMVGAPFTAREMARSTKCFPCKREDLRSVSRIDANKQTDRQSKRSV